MPPTAVELLHVAASRFLGDAAVWQFGAVCKSACADHIGVPGSWLFAAAAVPVSLCSFATQRSRIALAWLHQGFFLRRLWFLCVFQLGARRSLWGYSGVAATKFLGAAAVCILYAVRQRSVRPCAGRCGMAVSRLPCCGRWARSFVLDACRSQWSGCIKNQGFLVQIVADCSGVAASRFLCCGGCVRNSILRSCSLHGTTLGLKM